jgi:hypothetical protein
MRIPEGADVNEMERIWREKTDGQLLDAASALGEYTEEGRRVILAEMARRGLEPPEPAETEEVVEEGEGFGEGDETGEEQESDVLTCLRCDVELKYLGSSHLHEGQPWGVLGGLEDVFERAQRFDVYVCPRCGHLDFFAPPAAREKPVEG